MFEYSIFIGRFQPFHNAHLAACEAALSTSKHLIILIGSAFSSRSTRNPFTFQERREMIVSAIGGDNVTVLPARDFYYSDTAWVANIQKQVESITGPSKKCRIGMLKYKKDKTSYYLDYFPKWATLIPAQKKDLNAKDIRDDYLQNRSEWCDMVPKEVEEILMIFKTSDYFRELTKEYKYILEYRDLWSFSQYPIIFTTVDAVVFCCGNVLLVRRRACPGKGQYAIPGGFIHSDESIEEGVLRELKEETRIKIPKSVLGGSIKSRGVFDHPLRSTRGRTITHAYHFVLDNEKELPKVKGSDDADKAFWMPLNEVINNMDQFFEDHFQIIESFMNK